MTLPNGTPAVSGDILSYQQYNRLKDHWRQADPCANLADPQSGMIASDSDDEKLYHYQAAAWVEILQVGVVIDGNIHVGDDDQLIFGADSDGSIQYEETTNDALIFGIPVTPARGMIICDIADIGVDFSGLITATAQPNMFMVDLDNDSYMAIGYAGDDIPGLYSNRALYLQYAVAQDVEFFAGLAAGNPSIKISGWDANAAALDTYSINAGMDAGAGTRLTFGLDEVMRTMVICDYGDIAVDFGLAAATNPTLVIADAAGTTFAKYGRHTIIPQVDEEATPTLAFGDGNTGFYESSDNILRISIGGNQTFSFNATRFYSAHAGGIIDETATATNPVFLPYIDDVDTGIGRAVEDNLSLIAGGIEGMRLSEDTTISIGAFGLLSQKYIVTVDDTDGVVTYTAAEMFGGLIRRGTGDQITVNRIDVSATAAAIVASIPGAIVGSGYVLYINNEDSTHTIQLDGGAGVTISPNDPSNAIAANSTGVFMVVCTNVTAASEAVTIHALGSTTH